MYTNLKRRVGITGQSGFIGTHLYNTLGLYPDRFERIPFEDCFFEDQAQLNSFVNSCDVIVHLAAMNRYNDMQVIYDTNVGLVEKVISACENMGVLPHIIYSSSIHEDWDNLYGKSKRIGRELFEQWAERNRGARFTGFIMPNVFGPYGRPFFNSVVATFCYLLTHDGEPKIDVDNDVNFIYVADIIKRFIEEIELVASGSIIANVRRIDVPAHNRIKVSELLALLESYRDQYLKNGTIPSLGTPFERDLFNTFLGYIDHSSFFPFKLKLNSDERGAFVEIIKLNSGGQVSYSTTKFGITRGNHFHIRKTERFAVLKGKARIELRRVGTSEILSFDLDGSRPSFVDMPVWYTHNITNTGLEDLYTMFWISEHYDPNNPDTFPETV